ncbi:MAG: hypothetical protein M3134_02900 [Actinomycetota bacterium]|nr:hypothetical protein [Actinomycetota bacterium]
MSVLDDLIDEKRIERVVPDRARAETKLDEAERHLESSRAVAANDPEDAYALLYDAARKAVDAHMAANGLRVSKSRPAAHETTALYAAEVIGGAYEADGKALNRMRKQRNRAEYGSWHISAARLKKDHAHAAGIVEAIRRELAL